MAKFLEVFSSFDSKKECSVYPQHSKAKAFHLQTIKFDELRALWRWNSEIPSLVWRQDVAISDNGSNIVNCSHGVSESSLIHFSVVCMMYSILAHNSRTYLGWIFHPQVFKIAAVWITSVEAYLSKHHIQLNPASSYRFSLCYWCWATIQNKLQDYTSVFVLLLLLLLGRARESYYPRSVLSYIVGWTTPLIGMLLLVAGWDGV